MTEELAESAPAEPVVDSTPEVTEAPVEAVEQPSRMDALEKAFKAVDDADSESDAASNPEPAEAETAGPKRGPDGKFVPKDQTEAPKEDAPEATGAKPVEPKKNSEAPSRFSPDAKAKWAEADPAIQGEVNRAISEMEQGLAQKDALIEPLKPLMDLAAQSGTTLQDAMTNYVNLERLIAQDPKAGFERLATNMGKTLPDLIAQITGGESTATDKDRQVVGLEAKLNQLQSQFGQVSQDIQQQHVSQTEAQVSSFAEQNPRFDELSGEIARLLQTGYAQDLPSAYKIAEQLNPLTVAPVATMAPAQTRAPKSVTGSPTAGSTPANAAPSGTRTEAIRRALSASGF